MTWNAQRMRQWPLPFIAIGIVGVLLFSAGARATARSFLAALRIAKPPAESVNNPGGSGSSRTRQLQNIIGGMLAPTVDVVVDEPDKPAADAAAAAKDAGFALLLPRSRGAAPVLEVLGAHTVDMTVNRGQVMTMFSEAGRAGVELPEGVDGSKVTLRTPRAVRAQYGSCPLPVPNTIQGQVQGPPPPSTDNADCVVLMESPPIAADLPSGLDLGPLMEIALELSGMSPVQAQAVPQTLDWKSTLVISLPRNLRSVETKDVNGSKAMLLVTAGRRGPTWELVWARSGIVYALTGYGNSADALPLANSMN